MSAAIHQFVATAEAGAVGSHTLALRTLLRDRLGVASEIFTEHIRPPFDGIARPLADYGRTVPARPDDVAVYQMAIGSVVADRLLGGSERLVVEYHNLTPPRYLRSWDPDATYGVEWGLRQLADLGGRAELGLAVSEFNRGDLVGAGFRSSAVAPVLVDLAGFDRDVDAGLAARLADERAAGPLWLFVGRVAAHKCQHQVVRALAAYRRAYGVDARLALVGGPTQGPYVEALRSYIHELGLAGAVSLTGPVSDATLGAYYQQADVFVCLSEHEGFCVPLVEAMWHRIPIVTLASSAIPETVGGAAIVLPPEGPGGRDPGADDRQPSALAVAAAAERVRCDRQLRAALVDAGAARAEAFSLERSGAAHLAALAPLADR